LKNNPALSLDALNQEIANDIESENGGSAAVKNAQWVADTQKALQQPKGILATIRNALSKIGSAARSLVDKIAKFFHWK